MKNRINKLVNATLGLVLALTASVVSAVETEITYYVPDALGSPVAAMDEAGNVKWRKHYRPFGEEIEQGTEAKENRIGYTGHVHDSDTALTYMGARYYHPQIGRFLTMDPAEVNPNDPRTFNRYAYANNNPYKFVDPDGNTAKLLEWSARGGWAVGEGVNLLAYHFAGITVSTMLADAAWNVLHNESADDSGTSGKRRKNRIPDKGDPDTVATNPSGSTKKKYGSDGWVEKEWNKGHGPKAPPEEQDDHIHDWEPNPYHPDGRPTRQPGRKPDADEGKEFND